MNITIFWARLIGLYAVIISVGSFLELDYFHSLFVDMAHTPTIMMTLGLFTLILGLAIVLTHPIWKGWGIMVTLVGYMICIKGFLLLFFPHLINFALDYWQHHNMRFAFLPAFIVGFILLISSFFVKDTL